MSSLELIDFTYSETISASKTSFSNNRLDDTLSRDTLNKVYFDFFIEEPFESTIDFLSLF